MQAATRPVLIQQAETGTGHLLPLAEEDSVFALKEAIQGATGVPATYQILLLDGDKLEDKQTLAEYMLPDVHASARPVFLFDRRALSRSAEPPDLIHPTAPDIDVPETLPTDSLPRPDVEQESIPSPLVRALLDYERRFCLHLQQATALCDGGQGRLGASRQALVDQRVQAAALTAAVANLRGFAQQLSEKYTAFQARYAEIVPRQAALARSFGTDLEVLRAIRVQPAVCALEGLTEASLLDCCGQERLTSWLQECQNNTDHLMAKAAQFALQWDDLQAGVRAEEMAPAEGPASSAEPRISAAQALTAQQHSVLDQLAADRDAVKRLVDEQLEPAPAEGMSGSVRRGSSAKLMEEIGALESTHDTHLQALLPQLRSLDRELRHVQEEVLAAKGALSVRRFHRLRSISQLQSQIAELRNKLHLYSSLLERVNMYCTQLLLMRRLPATYHACLAEVVRRRQFGQDYARQAHAAAETLANAREEEVGRRDAFMREHGALLPRGMPQLSQLLGARPPFFEISSNSSDSQLMALSQALTLESGASAPQPAVRALPAPAAGAADSDAQPLQSADDDVPADDVAAAPPPTTRDPSAASQAAHAAGPDDPLAAGTAVSLEAGSEAPSVTTGTQPNPFGSDAKGMPAADVEARGRPTAAPEPSGSVGFGDLASGSTLAMPSIQRSMSEHSSLHKFHGMLHGSRSFAPPSSSAIRFAPLAPGGGTSLTKEAVLAGQCSGELSEVGAALEALGTPLEGLPVEVASQLQRRLAQQEAATAALRTERRAHATALEKAEAALAAERQRCEALQQQLDGRAVVVRSTAAATGVEAGSAAGCVQLHVHVQGPTALEASVAGASHATGPEAADVPADKVVVDAREAAAETEALREAVRELELKYSALDVQHCELVNENVALSRGVQTAMSCLPPPGPIRGGAGAGNAAVSAESGAAAGADTIGDGAAGDSEPGEGGSTGGDVRTVQLQADDLCSSARQAAHANARLGHAMAAEREAHKVTQTRAQRRLAYLSSDLGSQPPTRLLFTAQPTTHAPTGGVAFAGLLLPALRSGLPTHWLSSESVASLRRWCEDEGVPLTKLRAVVGKVVHVSGPLLAVAEGEQPAGQPANPYNLPEGETYHVVHAEMQLQHRWVS